MPPPLSVSLCLGALALLAACQADAPSDPDAPPSEDVSSFDPLDDVTPDQTAELVEDAERASPSVAVQTLDLWAGRLDAVRAEGAAADTLAALRDDLAALRGQLQSSPLDGAAIGRTLGRLGGQTAALDSGRVGLGGLARALTAAGGRLAPADSAEAGTPGDGPGVQ